MTWRTTATIAALRSRASSKLEEPAVRETLTDLAGVHLRIAELESEDEEPVSSVGSASRTP